MRSLLALAAALISSTALADSVTHYTFVIQGRPSGSQTTTTHEGGRVDTLMSFRDNGRGPDVNEHMRYAPDGTVTALDVTGKSTFGAPIDEHFTLRSKRAIWHSLADHGDLALAGPAAYIPNDGSVEAQAAFVRAALRQPQGKIAAIPGGEVAAAKVLDAQVTGGHGTRNVTLYAVTGIDVQPDFIWLDSTDQKLFALIYPGYLQLVEESYESQGAELEKLQLKAEQDRLVGLHTKLAHEFAGPILFKNVRVFDSEHAQLTDPKDVYVYRGKVATIAAAGSTPRDVGTVIEGENRVLMPALFDMHAHENTWNLLLQIAGGVTTSRDMGNDNARLQKIIDQVDAGEIVGSRIIPCGFIEGDSKYAASGGFRVKSVQEAKDAVEWYAQHGYHQIKIYNSFHPEWVAETAALAHQYGMRVSGHVPAFMHSEEAIRAGYDEIQHTNQLMLTFFLKPGDDTRTLARFYLIAENAHALDLSSQRVRDLVDLMKERHTVLDSTLTAEESGETQLQGEMNPSYAAVADHLPVAVRRQWLENSMDLTAKNADRYRKSFDTMVRFVGQLYQAGVPLEAGTDGIAGFTLHRELELYVRAGLTPSQALQVATWNGARFTRRLADLGSIAPGKRADMILIDGDPTQNISDIRKVSLTMKDGVTYFPSEIYESLGIRPFSAPPQVHAGTR